MTITIDTYRVLQRAYDYFNYHLFDDDLPECLITLVHNRKAYGYFNHKAFKERKTKGKITDEIALNPLTFENRSDREIFSTLVHEMVHLWQHHFGNPKKTHHDTEWADMMEELGLIPSSTGKPGGKRTGRKVSHYIEEGGLFDQVEKKAKLSINWVGFISEEKKSSRGNKRTKYTCPSCEINAYGKAGLSLICGECDEEMNPNK